MPVTSSWTYSKRSNRLGKSGTQKSYLRHHLPDSCSWCLKLSFFSPPELLAKPSQNFEEQQVFNSLFPCYQPYGASPSPHAVQKCRQKKRPANLTGLLGSGFIGPKGQTSTLSGGKMIIKIVWVIYPIP